jgi:phenylpyruvate tautomerase PptA (4-oxalocrotonate tautomerase family)
MPITLVATEGVLSEQRQSQVFAELTEAFLRHHGLAGNAFMTANVIGDVRIMPKGRSYAGGQPTDLVIVELKVPSFAFGEARQREDFIAEATRIVSRAARPGHPADRIFVNVVFAVDGLWGIGGTAFTNEQLGEAIRLSGVSA